MGVSLQKKLLSEDIENIVAIKNGDERAFEHVFKLHYPSLCAYAYSFLKDKDESEELVQQTFYVFWAKRHKIEIKQSIKSYLFRSVQNASTNKLKQIKTREKYKDYYKITAETYTNTASNNIQHKQLEKRLNEVIDSLPEQCKNTFKLSRFDHMKYSEISEIMGISTKTVESHISKALKILRVELKEYLLVLLLILTQGKW